MGNLIKLTESDLIGIVKKVISEQQTAAYAAGQAVGKNIKSVGQEAGQKVGSAVNAVKSAGQQAGQKVGSAIKNVNSQTIQIGKSVVKSFIVGNMMLFIIGGKAWKFQLELGKKVLSFLGSLGKQVGGIVIGGAKSVGNFTQDTLNKAATNAASFFNSLFNTIKTLGGKAWSAALSLSSKIGEIWKNISSWATNALKSAASAVKKVGQNVASGVKSAYKTASSAVDSVSQAASGLASGLFGEGVLEMMLEDYNYYNSLPINKMLNEIYFDNRYII
jgi:ABC-type transporter Mla subunit MlaD